MHWGIRAAHAGSRMFARIYHRLDVVRHERFPRSGPAIMVCNHTSGLDPVLIQSVIDRKISWMAAREYYDVKGTRWLYALQQSIPVDRNGKDTIALRTALRRLADGHILGVFPQGTIKVAPGPIELQTGIGLIAQRSQAVIYPVALAGTTEGISMSEAFTFRQHCRIAFGPPLRDFADTRIRESVDASTERIRQAMTATLALLRSGR